MELHVLPADLECQLINWWFNCASSSKDCKCSREAPMIGLPLKLSLPGVFRHLFYTTSDNWLLTLPILNDTNQLKHTAAYQNPLLAAVGLHGCFLRDHNDFNLVHLVGAAWTGSGLILKWQKNEDALWAAAASAESLPTPWLASVTVELGLNRTAGSVGRFSL